MKPIACGRYCCFYYTDVSFAPTLIFFLLSITICRIKFNVVFQLHLTFLLILLFFFQKKFWQWDCITLVIVNMYYHSRKCDDFLTGLQVLENVHWTYTVVYKSKSPLLQFKLGLYHSESIGWPIHLFFAVGSKAITLVLYVGGKKRNISFP